MLDLNFKYKDAVEKIINEAPFKPDIAIILGSGLGNFADSLKTHKIILTKDLPGYPKATIPGHTDKIYFSEYENKKILLFKGRIHLYEGYKIYECILPVFLSYKLGSPYLLITNAAGGVNKNFVPGDLMLAESFNGIQIKKELTSLIGITGIDAKNNFLNFPSPGFNNLINLSAEQLGIELKKGTYWYTKGPSYESPAEIQMMAKYGGDAVGMSTVHEAVFGAFLGMEISTVSCITNYASGTSNEKLSHKDVTTIATLIQDKFSRLLKGIIQKIPGG
jgi:purine-nucleoside phosphorylase